MTQEPISTPPDAPWPANPWDMATVYAACFAGFGGLFAPGLLRAAQTSAAAAANPNPAQPPQG